MQRMITGLIMAGLMVAQADAVMLNQGVREFAIGGQINQTRDINLELTVNGGYFIRDFRQIGAKASIAMLESGDFLQLGAGVYGEVNVPLHMRPLLYPYYGASCSLLYSSLSTEWADADEVAVEVAGYGGFKYFLLDNLAISSNLKIKLASAEIYFGRSEMERFDWVINLGTHFYF